MTPSTTPRPGRNDPCHCGSGRKYKHCCLEKDEQAAHAVRVEAAQTAAAEAPATPPPAPRPPKPKTRQPWKSANSHGFVPRTRLPRKVGGS